MRQFFLFIFISCLCFNNTYSQLDLKPSYIIKNKVDTIIGLGNISKDQKYCLFKKINDREAITYYPGDIDAFRILNEKYFISMQIPYENDSLTWCFLEFLVDGEIDLFALDYNRKFFMKKENDQLIELNDHKNLNKRIYGADYSVQDKKFLGYMRYYMKEAPELFPKIDKIQSLDQQKLVNIAVDYHNAICEEYECINYTKKIAKLSYKLESTLGVNYHNSYYSPYIGALFHFSPSSKYENIFLVVGLLYSDKPYVKKKESTEYSELDQYDYNIKFSGSLEFVFGKKKFKPTLSFGYIYGGLPALQGGILYSISNHYELILKVSYDGIPMESKELFNNNFGHSISIGFIYKIQ